MDLFFPADVLLPKKDTDMAKWAVVACDQFTSQPDYWQRVEDFVGGAPSTLRIILPEVFLGGADEPARIEAIHCTMDAYVKDVLENHPGSFVYVERTMASGAVRQGLVGCVDLETYSYEKGAKAPIRPSENTVKERIPPRVAVRRGGCLESPHIIMLIDDANATVIEPLAAMKDSLELLYDVDTMENGRRLRGWAVSGDAAAKVQAAVVGLGDAKAFEARYGNSDVFTMAVGDGNHSLASAKALWDETKANLSAGEAANHPGRYCLVELENVQSPAIEIEPIHRVVFGVDTKDVLAAAQTYARDNGIEIEILAAGEGKAPAGSQHFVLVTANGEKDLIVKNPKNPLPAGTFEDFISGYLAAHVGAEIDYVHGEDSVRELVKENCFGAILPPFEKSDLFMGVAKGGVLPKKTFSMGHAEEKRYYMECRRILRP